MPEEGYISAADISGIIRAINSLGYSINNVDAHVSKVDAHVSNVEGRVDGVETEVSTIKDILNDFIKISENRHNLSMANSSIIRIRQEIEKKFGHYDTVRRTTLGILQATDLQIVRQQTIQNLTEELLLTVPDYWLAPCLVALASWISNNQELANKALKEAIRRDPEKTCLLFAIICNRVNRKDASFKWFEYYYSLQNPYELTNTALLILDAYTSGILGNDSAGLIAKQFDIWMKEVSNKENFEQNQINQWKNIIKTKYPTDFKDSTYQYLPAYSPTWRQIHTACLKSNLHKNFNRFLEEIFKEQNTDGRLKEKIDATLYSLVSHYDQTEIAMREEEALNNLIIKYEGDKKRAQSEIDAKKSVYEEKKNFAELLIVALAENGIQTTPSTRQFIIAVSKKWMESAYNDLVLEDLYNIPIDIEVQFDDILLKSKNGENETKLIEDCIKELGRRKKEDLEETSYTFVIVFFVIGVLGACSLFARSSDVTVLGLVVSVLCFFISIIGFFVRRGTRRNLIKKYEDKIEDSKKIIKASMAEIVYFRNYIKEKQKEYNKVLDFISGILSKHFIQRNQAEVRKLDFSK